MSTLIERYLQTVRISLPSARRDDIVRELAADIREKVADREETLGRGLTADEQEAVLKEFGHPLMLATRYGPQRHVIGPALYPVYTMTLKIALLGAAGVNVALAIAFLANGSPASEAIGHLATFPFTIAVMVFGWVTLVFALIDLNLPRLLQATDVDFRGLVDLKAQRSPRRWSLIAEIVGSTAFLLWWLAIPDAPFLVFGPAAAFLALAPIWQQLYLPIAVIWLASIAVLWAVLLRPDWTRVRAVGRFVTDALSLVLAAILLKADAVVQLAPGVPPADNVVEVVRLINGQARIVVLIWLLAAIWSMLTTAWRVMTATSTEPE
jgi:hypothetical protein